MSYAPDELLKLLALVLPDLDGGEVLAAELPFRDVRHKADLAICSSTRLAAFEIKSLRDNVRRLVPQISAYREMFLEVSVAISKKHLCFVRGSLPESVGIVQLNESAAIWLRRPRPRVKLSRQASVNWLHRTELAKLLGKSVPRNLDIESLRAIAKDSLTEADLSQFALEAVRLRNLDRHAAFLREMSGRLSYDDVFMLSGPSRVR